ncbi:MAG: hypothetical protein U5K54_24065 [Cytophagales bacterium]|nr:hypothetical protein [Cytophagales bacterium]
MAAQFSVMQAISVNDFDNDGFADILLGGNLYGAKPEVGRYDASHGVLLKGDGLGSFISVPAKNSGLVIDGEVRDFQLLHVGRDNLLIVARNNDSVFVF